MSCRSILVCLRFPENDRRNHPMYSDSYNIQSAVDTDTHLIVTHDVINAGHDREQLTPMAKAAKTCSQTLRNERGGRQGLFQRPVNPSLSRGWHHQNPPLARDIRQPQERPVCEGRLCL